MVRDCIFAGFFAWVVPFAASGGACNGWVSKSVDERHYICHDTVGNSTILLAWAGYFIFGSCCLAKILNFNLVLMLFPTLTAT
jgi:hypothetical protein